MKRLLTAALAVALATTPALADEFTDVVQGALDAYADGDIKVTTEELEYAMKLLGGMKSESLAKFLPPALAGWTREDAAEGEAEGTGMAMAMFGGGTVAAATYRKADEELTITLVADSAMVTGIGGMLAGMAGLSGGKPIRIQRTQFAMNDNELQGVVDGEVLVSVSGDASIEDKTAYLEAMDLKALGDF
jgi:hypothetical protein